MDTSVVFIILNYETYEDTIVLVKEILGFDPLNSRIIIVDNCSPNDSYKQLKDAFGNEQIVDVIASSENGGYAKGNNIGLRYAKKYHPQYACIINNDVHFSSETISQLIRDVETNLDVGAIAPKQLLPNGEEAPFSSLKINTFMDDLCCSVLPMPHKKVDYKATTEDGRLMKVGIVPGAFVFMKYIVAEKIGFFDESTFLYCEERFLSKRLEEEGLGCYIDIKDSYIHAHSKTIDGQISAIQKKKLILRSRQLFIERYSKHGKLKSAILAFFALTVINVKSLYRK